MSQCRFCKTALTNVFLDLGLSPVSNAFIAKEDANKPEVFYPLITYVCDKCLLVQAIDFESAAHHFHDNYIYFSSFSSDWVAHAKTYAEKMIAERSLDKSSQVIELASNDGYLLQHFLPHQIPVLGIEPSRNVAEAAERKGIPSLVKFFTNPLATELAGQGKKADLIAGNNVLAHVPEIGDFVKGIATLLKPEGCVTLEFPWLYNMITQNQFDTIYHEHYSYLSLHAVTKIFEEQGLQIFDVEELVTHGGSLRIFGKLKTNKKDTVTDRVNQFLQKENSIHLNSLEGYRSFAAKVHEIKFSLLQFLIEKKRAGKKVAAYGAPAKGNTLLNYCGVGPELISFTVDKSPHKQGKLLPGTRIPVKDVQAIYEEKPDYILILPWNLKTEIVRQMSEVSAWGCKFVVPIPRVEQIN